jgi:hypothetical protein
MFGLTPATFPQEQIEAATDACTRGEFEANTETYRVFGDDFIASFAAGITSSAQAGGVSTQIAAIKLRNLIIRPPALQPSHRRLPVSSARSRRMRSFDPVGKIPIQVRARPRKHKEHEYGCCDQWQRQQAIERSHEQWGSVSPERRRAQT